MLTVVKICSWKMADNGNGNFSALIMHKYKIQQLITTFNTYINTHVQFIAERSWSQTIKSV